jgi:fructose-1,6-bisphosphatase
MSPWEGAMTNRRTTFSKYIIEAQRRSAETDRELTGLLNDIQTACKFIALAVSRGALNAHGDTATYINVQGEEQ